MKISIIGNTANAMILFRLDLIKTLTKKGISVYAFATDYNDSSKEIIKKAGAIPVDYNLSRSGINLVGDLWNTTTSPMTPEQIEIRELKKRLQRVEMERDILKNATETLMSDSLNNSH